MSNTVVAPATNGTIDLATLRQCLPENLRKSVNQDMVDLVNSFTDPEAQENYVNNLITYTHILKTGKFKLSSYFDAVRYCGFRIMGKSIIDAYALTFPDRYRNHLQNGVSQHDLYTYASCYNKRELVTKIMEQQMIPVYISHQHMFYESLQTQYDLMRDTKVSPKVRSDAAAHLMKTLAPPQESRIQLDVSTTATNTLNDLKLGMAELVDLQRTAIQEGKVSAKDIAEHKLIDVVAEQ